MFMSRESLCVWYPYAADASRLTVPVNVLSSTAGPPRQARPTGGRRHVREGLFAHPGEHGAALGGGDVDTFGVRHLRPFGSRVRIVSWKPVSVEFRRTADSAGRSLSQGSLQSPSAIRRTAKIGPPGLCGVTAAFFWLRGGRAKDFLA